ncbi:response regulator [Aerosakkonemataceae cyanobacterium BLCC-F50]|uniref:histidine kinase n=1 Tax=Floridaenema flaviceps BLCC-F50 TaxID=3153642 RepID=A0ABV4XK51_9CYAN
MARNEIAALLVEDNPADMVLLMELLQDSDEQAWQISHCKRLNVALEQLQQNTFDVVLLDLSLPDSQGLDTLVQLHRAVPHIPIVVLTGLQDKNLARQAVAQGAQDYLVKGQISSELLVKTIEYAIERSQILRKLQDQTQELVTTNEILQQREREFRTLVENTPDIIARYDRQFCCLYTNPASTNQLEILTSYSGKTLFQLGYPQEMIQFLETALERVFTTGQIEIDEFRVKYQEEWKTYQTYVVPEFRADGSIETVLTIARDITQLRETEIAFAQAQTANRMKDEFLATLSHELRTPLNPILGWVKLLRTRQFSVEQTQTALETIERNAQRQAQLVEDLLDVSQMIRGQLTLTQAPVLLSEPIQAAIETVRLAAQAKNLEIETKFDLKQGYVRGDIVRLQQLIWNLLTNAVKFTPNGGKIMVQLEQINHDAQITVRDTGKGIKPDFLPFVFDRFRQEDSSTTRQFGGLGLGLALVRQLVEAHGGTITAQSPGEGQGATFTVRLPLLLEPQPVTPHLPTSNQTSDLQGTRILLVEDEHDSRELIAWILKEAGAKLVAVGSANVALNTLRQTTFDVLVSDIGLPDMDGYRLLQQVRRLASAEALPAIALTAYGGEINRQTALASGYQQHLAKPIEPNALVCAIAELIGQKT